MLQAAHNIAPTVHDTVQTVLVHVPDATADGAKKYINGE